MAATWLREENRGNVTEKKCLCMGVRVCARA